LSFPVLDSLVTDLALPKLDPALLQQASELLLAPAALELPQL
jgi:hypothetical protein